MGFSVIDAQREIILETIRQITKGDWKVLVLDDDSKRLIDNVIEQDSILNENITNIEQITDRRPINRDVEAIYILSPLPHIVDCVMADFERRRYKRSHLIWTSLLHPSLRNRIDQSNVAREQIALYRVLNVEFFPRESHLVTFRDPWSFPILFHPACNNLVRQHMEDLATKIVGLCVVLGEYPAIRYYRPRSPSHEASILCSHLARFVQDELDQYAKFHEDFPPATTRPRGTLYIVDRSMDLFAPILHEFTYQAMAHDLLPIREGDKITYRTVINEGQPTQEEKDIEISERDKIWVENRHRHMKDTIDKLMADFQRFIQDNPNFTKESEGGANSLNAIKDMLAGLPQFQEMKEAYALHLGMAQESMNRFQTFKLADLASVEQILSTGLDEEYKKPKGVADQVVRMLDESSVTASDRLRLLFLFLLYRDGLLPADLDKLLAHAQLPPQDAQRIRNLEHLGVRTSRTLKDPRPPALPLFPRKAPPTTISEEYALSRFEPALERLLVAHSTQTIDAEVFPYTKPPLETGSDMHQNPAATSLRAAKPTWAKSRSNAVIENRPRVIVFMAGGATYSEARACYNTGRATHRDVVLATSHMLTPSLFLRQVGDLSNHPQSLDIPATRPKPKAPAHLFEPEPRSGPPQAQQPAARAHVQAPVPPTQGMSQMNLNGRSNGSVPHPSPAPHTTTAANEPEKKKKHRLFGKKDR